MKKQAARLRKRHPAALGRFEDGTLLILRDELRKAWDTADEWDRDWYVHQFRDNVRTFALWPQEQEAIARTRGLGGLAMFSSPEFQQWENDRFRPPLRDELNVALFHLQRIGELAKHCRGPECQAPYFIALKRWQKYCSPECTGPATRDSKRRWWRENRAKDGGLR